MIKYDFLAAKNYCIKKTILIRFMDLVVRSTSNSFLLDVINDIF